MVLSVLRRLGTALRGRRLMSNLQVDYTVEAREVMVPRGDFLVASLMPLFPLKPHVYINSPTLFEGNSQPSELVKSQPLL